MKKCIPAVLGVLSVLTAGCFSSNALELMQNRNSLDSQRS